MMASSLPKSLQTLARKTRQRRSATIANRAPGGFERRTSLNREETRASRRTFGRPRRFIRRRHVGFPPPRVACRAPGTLLPSRGQRTAIETRNPNQASSRTTDRTSSQGRLVSLVVIPSPACDGPCPVGVVLVTCCFILRRERTRKQSDLTIQTYQLSGSEILKLCRKPVSKSKTSSKSSRWSSVVLRI